MEKEVVGAAESMSTRKDGGWSRVMHLGFVSSIQQLAWGWKTHQSEESVCWKWSFWVVCRVHLVAGRDLCANEENELKGTRVGSVVSRGRR